ncbi:putative prefoldin subunit 1 [Yarrowia sp. C11]|nr:putative prefoldin subunit 1 [Yarrowia sp. E02]KAG5371755.1 putative prefoldin subunit 1 [Yarrowia sp. C11]
MSEFQLVSNELTSKSAEQQSVKAQIESANRQLRLIDLSRQQLEAEKSDVVWQGVGKMFVKKDKTSYLEELSKDKKKGEEALDTLKKKLTYVDVSLENARKRLEQLLKAAGQGQ